MRSIGKALSIVLTVALSWSLAAPIAQAKPKKPAAAKKVVTAETTEKGYAYDFSDDPLYGTHGAANAARIIVRPRGVRNTLLRPRLHFIPELLKSVENL